MRRLLVGIFFFVQSAIVHAAEKPNIVFILADDLGWAELGCYGQVKIKTPRIDSLAAEGMRFTRAYSGNAVCAPSRCVLMTGKHPGHATVRNNRSMRAAGEPEGQFPLPNDEPTIATLLSNQGYTCGVFGKWGLGNMNSTGNPLKKGFDRFFGYNCQAVAHSLYPASLWSDQEIFPLKNKPPIPGHAVLQANLDENAPSSYDQFKGQDYAPERINQEALSFIQDNHKKGPFFLYYPTVIPHLALQVPDDSLAPYLAEDWEETPFTGRKKRSYTPHFTPRAGYAAFISQCDTYVGRILDLLRELKLENNTIVVFTSDNGASYLPEVDFEFFQSVGELRGLKGSLYEGGIRIPQIVKWPGKVAPSSDTDALTGFEDWLPTLLDLTDLEATTPKNIDGVSLAPVLLGEATKGREFLYREFPAYGHQQAVWLGQRWKGIRQNMKKKGVAQFELYDLKKDSSESNNVAESFPDISQTIKELMVREHTASADFLFPALDGRQ